MLGKLMKHKFIASYRTYVPVYAALYIFSVLIFFSLRVQNTLISSLLIVIFSLLLGAMVIFTIYILVISLGTRVYGKPGYLLFSVPAKTSEIMLSKFIANFIWILAFDFVSITVLFIAFSMMGILTEVSDILSLLWTTLDLTTSNIFMFIVFGIVMIAYYIAFFMFLFALLNLIYKGEKKIFIGVLFYLALSFFINLVVNMLSL